MRRADKNAGDFFVKLLSYLPVSFATLFFLAVFLVVGSGWILLITA